MHLYNAQVKLHTAYSRYAQAIQSVSNSFKYSNDQIEQLTRLTTELQLLNQSIETILLSPEPKTQQLLQIKIL